MSHFFHSWCLASSYVNGTYVGGLFVLGGGACARVAASRQGGATEDRSPLSTE